MKASDRKTLPAGIWALGFVSMFMDISSEMIHSLLPVFIISVLGGSVVMVGIIEGVGESTALIVKLFSGVISDHLKQRKPFAVLGYSLATLSKPVFALALTPYWVLAARFIDRVGKGIRGAPRDALVADLVAPEIHGAAYGLRQSLDTLGAFLGPVLAIVLMILLSGDIRLIFWIAIVPGSLAVLLLVIGVREPEHTTSPGEVRIPVQLSSLRYLTPVYWWIVVIGGCFTLARFSEAFLILRAQESGLAISYVPMVLVIMNIIYATSAYPFGVLSDRISRKSLLLAGLLVLIAADVVLAYAGNLMMVFIGVALWGLHMGMTQGLLSALVADVSPVSLRGSAFGIFNLVSGIAMLVASVLAGVLWEVYGAETTFFVGAAFSLAALVLLLVKR